MSPMLVLSVAYSVLAVLFELPLSLLLVRATTPRMMAKGTRRKAKFRIDRIRRRRLASCSSYSRRASRFMRWRSRLACFDTGADSTDGPRPHWGAGPEAENPAGT